MAIKYTPLNSLQDAHTAMCQWCVDVCSNPDSPLADRKLVVQFLKDNRIEAVATPGSETAKAMEAAGITPVIAHNDFMQALTKRNKARDFDTSGTLTDCESPGDLKEALANV